MALHLHRIKHISNKIKSVKWADKNKSGYDLWIKESQRKDNRIALVEDIEKNVYGTVDDPNYIAKFHKPKKWAHYKCTDSFAQKFYITCTPGIAKLYETLEPNCIICDKTINEFPKNNYIKCDTIFNEKLKKEVQKLSIAKFVPPSELRPNEVFLL